MMYQVMDLEITIEVLCLLLPTMIDGTMVIIGIYGDITIITIIMTKIDHVRYDIMYQPTENGII